MALCDVGQFSLPCNYSCFVSLILWSKPSNKKYFFGIVNFAAIGISQNMLTLKLKALVNCLHLKLLKTEHVHLSAHHNLIRKS